MTNWGKLIGAGVGGIIALEVTKPLVEHTKKNLRELTKKKKRKVRKKLKRK